MKKLESARKNCAKCHSLSFVVGRDGDSMMQGKLPNDGYEYWYCSDHQSN